MYIGLYLAMIAVKICYQVVRWVNVIFESFLEKYDISNEEVGSYTFGYVYDQFTDLKHNTDECLNKKTVAWLKTVYRSNILVYMQRYQRRKPEIEAKLPHFGCFKMINCGLG